MPDGAGYATGSTGDFMNTVGGAVRTDAFARGDRLADAPCHAQPVREVPVVPAHRTRPHRPR
jgi:hypothetical protein